MKQVLSQLLGLKADKDAGGDWSFRLSELWDPAWPLLLLLAALAIYYVWQYRRDSQRLTAPRRYLLMSLRIGIVCLVVLMLIRPALNIAGTDNRTPVVAVLIDDSLSMDFPDARNHPLVPAAGPRTDRSRYAVARTATHRLLGPLELNKNHRVVVYKFSSGADPDARPGNKQKATARRVGEVPMMSPEKAGQERAAQEILKIDRSLTRPSGTHSHPGDALIDVLKDLAGNKISGMVLISDGRSTATPLSGAITLDAAAQRLKQAGIRVSTIATGTAEPLRNLDLADLAAPKEANLDDIMNLRVTVINNIEPGLQTELSLYEDDNPRPRVVHKVRLAAGRNDVVLSMLVEDNGSKGTKGKYPQVRKYTVKAPHFEDEMSYTNNTISRKVNIVNEKLRCLFIAGKPTIEYHYLWPALVRDPIINVSCWLLDADINYVQQGKIPIDKLPQTAEEWNKYHVVILYDIDPEKITNEQETGLEQLIRTGGGLFMIAGRNHGLDALLTVRSAKFAAMLPVEIDRNKHPDYNQVLSKPFKTVRTKAGRQHPLFMFDKNMTAEGNDKIWDSFPDLFWAHPTVGVKPQAISLLEKAPILPAPPGGEGPGLRGDDPDGKTLMAMWRYGEGAVLYCGTDALWRWRYPFENYDHNRFFSQIVRYLGETRLLGTQRQVVLQTDRRLYAPGGDVRISLTVLDPALLSQLKKESLSATITDPEKATYRVPLTLANEKSQTFVGQYRPKRVVKEDGDDEYMVQADHSLADASSAQKKVYDEKTFFDVKLQSLEDVDKTADLEGLARLAAATGGKAYDHTNIKDLGELPGTMPTDPQLIPYRTEKDIWDSPLFLVVFLCGITAEWVLRKKWSLL